MRLKALTGDSRVGGAGPGMQGVVSQREPGRPCRNWEGAPPPGTGLSWEQAGPAGPQVPSLPQMLLASSENRPCILCSGQCLRLTGLLPPAAAELLCECVCFLFQVTSWAAIFVFLSSG